MQEDIVEKIGSFVKDPQRTVDELKGKFQRLLDELKEDEININVLKPTRGLSGCGLSTSFAHGDAWTKFIINGRSEKIRQRCARAHVRANPNCLGNIWCGSGIILLSSGSDAEAMMNKIDYHMNMRQEQYGTQDY